MSLNAAWAFADESALLMETDMGWDFGSTSVGAADRDTDVPTYTGSPTRYAMWLAWASNTAEPPVPFQPLGNKGCWAGPVRVVKTGNIAIGTNVYTHNGITGNGGDISIRVTSTTNLGLYILNVFHGNTQNLDLTIWHYWCLKSDMSGVTWTGEMWIDGIQEATGSSAPTVAAITSNFFLTSASATIGGAATTYGTGFGGLSYWTDTADNAEVEYYSTNVEPNQDATNVRTWVSSEATAWESVDTPLDIASDTTEASPSPSDRVNVLIEGAGGTDTLATHLGISPATIAGVCLHTWSTGESLNARAVLGDGTNEVNGITVAIDVSNTTYAAVASENTPTGPAWAAGDQPELNYETL
jgi:hypothetical protein